MFRFDKNCIITIIVLDIIEFCENESITTLYHTKVDNFLSFFLINLNIFVNFYILIVIMCHNIHFLYNRFTNAIEISVSFPISL